MLPLLSRTLRAGDTYVDVGAHWGLYTVVASRLVGREGRVVAVEPYAPSAAVLRRNLEHSGCQNVTVVEAALAEAQGEGRLRVLGESDNLSRLGETPAGRGAGPSVPCRLLSLEDLWREQGLSTVRLMKIDIEGGETRLVQGLRALSPSLEGVLLEAHPPYPPGFDVRSLYGALAQDRALLAVDTSAGAWHSVRSPADFDAWLPRYYFLSLGRGFDDEPWDGRPL